MKTLLLTFARPSHPATHFVSAVVTATAMPTSATEFEVIVDRLADTLGRGHDGAHWHVTGCQELADDGAKASMFSIHRFERIQGSCTQLERKLAESSTFAARIRLWFARNF